VLLVIVRHDNETGDGTGSGSGSITCTSDEPAAPQCRCARSVLRAVRSKHQEATQGHYELCIRRHRTPAQRVDTPPGRLAARKRLRKQDPTGIDKPEHDGEGDSVSVAKMGMIGTIGAALVTAVTTIALRSPTTMVPTPPLLPDRHQTDAGEHIAPRLL
jgi:hypothetical protein